METDHHSGGLLTFQAQYYAEGEHTYRPNIELMQYTGLEDKNGKEVYEGDILKALIDSKMGSAYFDVGEVVFHPNAAQFVLRKGNGVTNIAFNVEVIGNIYENPELLK
jgi:uncharacterized phage protein (TIGR01671 family)